jgi:hypothetical protein
VSAAVTTHRAASVSQARLDNLTSKREQAVQQVVAALAKMTKQDTAALEKALRVASDIGESLRVHPLVRDPARTI